MVQFRNIALIIGINHYDCDSRIASLTTAKFDAIKLAEILKRDYEYDVELLTDERQQATCENLRQALARLSDRVKGGQDQEKVRLLFYFAGHGIPSQKIDGESGYLVAQDAEVEQFKNFLPMKELHDTLTNLDCHHALIVLDCCFAGTFKFITRDLDFVQTPEEISKERYKRYVDGAAWQVITSAAHDQKALDIALDVTLDNRLTNEDREQFGDPEKPNSPFAAALIWALDKTLQDNAHKPADYTKDGITTATELVVFLDKEMRQRTKETNHQQIPRFWPLQKHDKGEFFFETGEFDPDRLPDTPALNQENNPYRGLESFDEAQQRFFFGREDLVKELQVYIDRDHHPFTVVLGVSGSGKSSLVKAGLIPQLRSLQASPWQILPPMRPGLSPLKALAKVLLPLEQESNPDEFQQLEQLTENLRNARKRSPDNKALTQLLAEWRRNDPDGKLRLIITKFEQWQQIVENDRHQLEQLRQTGLHRSGLVLEHLEELKLHCNPEEQQALEAFYQHCTTQIESWSQQWQHNPEYLCALIEQWFDKQTSRKLLLVIDQFEELITQSQEGERDAFLMCLQTILQNFPQQLRVVPTLRADFESRFADNKQLQEFWQLENRFFVRPMRRDEFRQVIEGPAQDYVLSFGVNDKKYSLVDQLINEVELMPGGLSLLSFTLSELYREYVKSDRNDRTLSWDDYRNLNGVTGSLTRRATDEYKTLDEQQQVTMRRVMLRMVTLEGGETARRRVPDSELIYPTQEESDRVKQVVDRLVNARLLVKGQLGTGETYVEPAHDFLVRGWDKLQGWLKESQEDIMLQHRLTTATTDWSNGRGILWFEEVDRLAKLEKVLDSETENWLNRLEQEFVTQSILERQNRIKKLEEDLRISEERRLAAELELGSVRELRQFEIEKGILPLQNATRIAHELVEWVQKNNRTLRDYPTVSPLFTLQTILDRLYEHEYFFCSQETDAFWNWLTQGAIPETTPAQFETGHGESLLIRCPDGQYFITIETEVAQPNRCRWRIWQQPQEPLTDVLEAEIEIDPAHFSRSGNVPRFSESGKIIVLKSFPVAEFYNLAGDLVGKFSASPGFLIEQITLSPDDSEIAIIERLDGGEGTQRLHFMAQYRQTKETSRFQHNRYFYIEEVSFHRVYGSMRFTADSQFLVTANSQNTNVHPVRVWHLESHICLKLADPEQLPTVPLQRNLEFHWQEGKAECLDQDQVIAVLEGQKDWFEQIILSPQQTWLISIDRTYSVRLWQRSGTLIANFAPWRGASLGRRVFLSPNDNYCALVDRTGVNIISLADVLEKSQVNPDRFLGLGMTPEESSISQIQGSFNQFFSLSFSPDGERIVSVGMERTIRVWDLKARQLAELNLTNPQIARIVGAPLDMGDGFDPNVVFSLDGQWIIFTYKSRGFKPDLMWQVETLEDLIERSRKRSSDYWQDDIGKKIKRLIRGIETQT